MDAVFKALSDKNRRKILQILHKKDMTAGEICKQFDITGASVSHHLDVLKKARLVVAERKGQFISYSLNTSVFEDTLNMIMSAIGGKNA
jgi:DNA-binding transcriptional ArsR family regulator